jgi:hypothetical protein
MLHAIAISPRRTIYYAHTCISQLWNSNDYILAEVGTHQLEYRYLSRATGKREYAEKSMRAFDILRALQPSDGLLFEHIAEGKNNIPTFANGKVSFGAMGDSAYEYMLKIWIQGGRKEDVYRRMYDKAIAGMHEQLLHKSSPSGLTYIANRIDCRIEHKMDHLVCFLGGTLALGAYTDPLGVDSPRARRDLKTARSLAYTCYQMYARTRTGMAPEYVRFEGENDMVVPSDSPYSILRPEAVEAFYYLSTLTGDPMYRVSYFHLSYTPCETRVASSALSSRSLFFSRLEPCTLPIVVNSKMRVIKRNGDGKCSKASRNFARRNTVTEV